MGNKLYVDSNVSNIGDLINFDSSSLNGNLSISENYHNLKVWQFFENDDEKILSKPVHLPSMKEEKFLLSSLEVYIILLVYKEEIADISPFPSNLWGIVESSSNMTPRGLKHAFSTSNDQSQNLESYLLSKRNFVDSEYKYFLFIWNGKNSSAMLKSEALMRAFELDKKLSDPVLLPYLYSGYSINQNKLMKGKTVNLNAIINNTIEHFSDEIPLTPSVETFLSYQETVYLLQWLYPMENKLEKKNSGKTNPLFSKFNNAFVTKSKTDYYKGFVNLDGDMKDIPQVNKDEVLKEDSYEDNDTSSLVDEDIHRTESKPPTIKGFSLGNLDNLKKDKDNSTKQLPNEEPKVPRLNMRIHQTIVNEEAMTTRAKQNVEEEEKLDNLPPQTIKRASDGVRNLLGLKIKSNQKKEEPQYIPDESSRYDEPESPRNREEEDVDDELEESERKEMLMSYYNKNISIIIEGFLYLSGYNVAKNKDILDTNRITHIVNAAYDVCQNHFESKIKYLSFNLKDHASEVRLKFIIEYRMCVLRSRQLHQQR
jgi:hypothetical protein